MKIRFIDVRSKTQSVTVALVGDTPLVHGQVYTVSDKVGALLLAFSGQWEKAVLPIEPRPAVEAGEEAQLWDFFKEVSGIDDELAQTLWFIGYESWESIRKDVEANGIGKLTRLPGIGPARAKAIYQKSTGE